MNKKYIMSMYYKMCIFIGLGALLSLYLYLAEYPSEMYGVISKSFFTIDFGVSPDTDIEVFSSILIIFFIIFLINLGALIFALIGEKMEGLLLEGSFYNTIISFLLIVSYFAFYFQIPDIVNGEINHGLISSDFYSLADLKVVVYNFGYLLITIYLFYNIYVVYRLIPQSISYNDTEVK